MDSDDRNDFSFRNDRWGPETEPQLRISHRGPGSARVYIDNPVSWVVDALSCLPFLSLRGGQDAASEAVREGIEGVDQGAPVSTGPGVYQSGGWLGDYGRAALPDTSARAVCWPPGSCPSLYGQGAPMGQRDDLNAGKQFALWGSRKNLPGVKR